MKKLTTRQEQVLAFVQEQTRALGYPPTLREIADRLGVGSTSAWSHVRALVGKGYLVRDKSQARALRCTTPSPGDATLAMKITAGDGGVGAAPGDHLLFLPTLPPGDAPVVVLVNGRGPVVRAQGASEPSGRVLGLYLGFYRAILAPSEQPAAAPLADVSV